MSTLPDTRLYCDRADGDVRWTLRVGTDPYPLDGHDLYSVMDIATAFLAERYGFDVEWARRDGSTVVCSARPIQPGDLPSSQPAADLARRVRDVRA